MSAPAALLVSLVTVVACSASAPHAPAGGAPPPRDAAVLPVRAVDAGAPALASCPAAFAQATGRACTGAPDVCTYPEGTCQCGAAAWCGGAAPPAGYGDVLTWQCTPRVRGDGCPGEMPSGACARDGQVCDYTCSCVETATCTGGSWQAQSGPCKPSARPGPARILDDGGE